MQTTRSEDQPPRIGEHVELVCDVLVEFQAPPLRAHGRNGPRIWRFLPRGTRGRVIAHQGDTDRVLLEPSREIAYVRPLSMAGMHR
jgi:hypothetical protein